MYNRPNGFLTTLTFIVMIVMFFYLNAMNSKITSLNSKMDNLHARIGNVIARALQTISDRENQENSEETFETEEVVIAIQEDNTDAEITHQYYYMNDNGYKYYLDNDLQDYLYDLLVDYGLEEYYKEFISQLYVESNFISDLISGTNDYGIAQINVCNHGWLRNQLGITDFLDPYQSIKCQVHIMSGCFEKYNDVERAFVCYNRGNAIGVSSTSYSRKVLQCADKLVEII